MRFDPRLEAWRVQQGTWRSPTGVTFGSFFVPFKSYRLYVMACDGTETGDASPRSVISRAAGASTYRAAARPVATRHERGRQQAVPEAQRRKVEPAHHHRAGLDL